MTTLGDMRGRSRPATPVDNLDEILAALSTLAGTPEIQFAWCEHHRWGTDELRMEFTDVVPLWLPHILEAGVITPEQATILESFSEYLLGNQFDRQAMWITSLDGLREPEWNRIRDGASRALDAITR